MVDINNVRKCPAYEVCYNLGTTVMTCEMHFHANQHNSKASKELERLGEIEASVLRIESCLQSIVLLLSGKSKH
jgi:hypothetical protein